MENKKNTLRILIYSLDVRDRVIVTNIKEDNLCIYNKIYQETDIVIKIGKYGVILRNSCKTLNTFKWIENKYATENKSLYRLTSALKRMKKDDLLCILDENKSTISERKSALDFLKVPSDYKDINQTYDKILNFYKLIESTYNYYSLGFDGLKMSIGEQDKDKRKCRFCGRTGKENFHDIAHAIQDSLGNSLLICNEECDACNHTLNKIEDNFLHVMDVRRSIFHISRKSSTKSATIYGRNFVLKPDEKDNTTLYLMEENITEEQKKNKRFTYKLIHKTSLSNENVYKALVKIVIDLLPSKELPYFKQTIKWVKANNDWYIDSLPDMYLAISDQFNEQPYIDILIRKQDDENTPYCTAILWIYDLVYVFIIPLVEKDEGKFKYNNKLQTHWKNIFNLYPFEWIKQNTSDWQEAYAWVDMSIDLDNPAISIRSMNTPIFEKCLQEKVQIKETVFPFFEPKYITLNRNDIKTNFTSIFNEQPVEDKMLHDVTETMSPIILTINENEKTVILEIDSIVYNQTQEDIFFKYYIHVPFKLQEFGKYIHLKWDENNNPITFAFDFHLRDFIFKVSILFAEIKLSLQRASTPFRNSTIIHFLNDKNIDRYLNNTVYLITKRGGGYYRIYDKDIHQINYYKPKT